MNQYCETFKVVDKNFFENLPEHLKTVWDDALKSDNVVIGRECDFISPELYQRFVEGMTCGQKDPWGIPNVCFSIAEPDDERWSKWKQQRMERGFDDTELWNLDVTMARFILPRLKVYKESTFTVPGTIIYEVGGEGAMMNNDPELNDKAEKKWMEILDDIIWSLENYEKEPEYNDDTWLDEYKKWDEKVHKGLELLGKYFSCIND